MDSKIKSHAQLLARAFTLIVQSGVCPDTPMRDWVKYLLYLHKKGWLWVAFEDNDVALIAAAYRIKEFNDKTADRYPEQEEGDILFVPWMASKAKDKTLPKRLLTKYTKENPDIKEVIFYDYSEGEKLRRFKRGGQHGKEKRPGTT